MSMQVGSGNSSEPDVMIEMNMTPLIDVMLVLIIMLIITIPIQNHSIDLKLPTNTNAPPPLEKPVVVTVQIEFDGVVSWNGVDLASPNAAELERKFKEVASNPNQPEVHIRPNKLVEYKYVAAVMAAAQRQGVTKIGMVGNEQYMQ
jgi:biopolymer transport protein ExbD